MAEEAPKEVVEYPRRLFSEEFLFLVERIDRVEDRLNRRIDSVEEKLTARINEVESKLTTRINEVESKLTARIDAVEGKLTARMDTLEERLNNIRFWAIGAVISILVGFIGTIVTLAVR